MRPEEIGATQQYQDNQEPIHHEKVHEIKNFTLHQGWTVWQTPSGEDWTGTETTGDYTGDYAWIMEIMLEKTAQKNT